MAGDENLNSVKKSLTLFYIRVYSEMELFERTFPMEV